MSRSLPVTLQFERYETSEGTAVVVDRTMAARLGRALLAFFIFLGIAFLGVFVPVAHFVLVPGFLITGIVMFVLRLKETTSLVELHYRCPRCKDKDVKIIPESGPFRDGRKSRCSQCAEPLRLTLHTGSPG